jgi:hypothetical protein
VFINTRLLQAVLRDPAWAGGLRRKTDGAVSGVLVACQPHGRFRLDMDTRLDLTAV